MKTTFKWSALAVLLAGCAPVWNWRELQLPGAGLAASFPCKPDIKVVGDAGLAVCEAQGWTFSLAWQDLARGDRVIEAVGVSASQLTRRLGSAQAPAPLPALAPPAGALPASGAGGWRIRAASREGVLLTWGHRVRVYQALVQGPRPPDDEAMRFLSGFHHVDEGVGTSPASR